jgi:hypothetical protein
VVAALSASDWRRQAVVGLELEQCVQQAAAMLGASGHWGDNAQLWRQEEASGREADGRAPLEFPFSDLTNMHFGFWLRKIS